MPKPNAEPTVLILIGETMVIDALNVGRVAMKEHSDQRNKQLRQSGYGFCYEAETLWFYDHSADFNRPIHGLSSRLSA